MAAFLLEILSLRSYAKGVTGLQYLKNIHARASLCGYSVRGVSACLCQKSYTNDHV